jgi:hypothetical protein
MSHFFSQLMLVIMLTMQTCQATRISKPESLEQKMEEKLPAKGSSYDLIEAQAAPQEATEKSCHTSSSKYNKNSTQSSPITKTLYHPANQEKRINRKKSSRKLIDIYLPKIPTSRTVSFNPSKDNSKGQKLPELKTRRASKLRQLSKFDEMKKEVYNHNEKQEDLGMPSKFPLVVISNQKNSRKQLSEPKMEGNGLIEKEALKTGKKVNSPFKIDPKIAKLASNPLQKAAEYQLETIKAKAKRAR